MTEAVKEVVKEAPSKARPAPYVVASVQTTDAPGGGNDGRWCEYILENGSSTINGCRNGTVKQVTEYAKEFAEVLNERQSGARYYPSASRKKAG